MDIHAFTVSPFEENCYVCHDGGEAVIVDPGCYDEAERQAVLAYLERHRLTVRHLLLTHAHLDHIFGCAFFARQFGMAFQMHPEDVPLLKASEQQAQLFGFGIDPPPAPGRLLREGDTVSFGNTTWEVLHCPGHSPGSICFHDADEQAVIAGDVLFQGSIGRTDLWRGSLPELLTSIREKLLPLEDATRVYPGHGPATTIGFERQHNPWL